MRRPGRGGPGERGRGCRRRGSSFRPYQALRHGRLGDEEGAGELGRARARRGCAARGPPGPRGRAGWQQVKMRWSRSSGSGRKTSSTVSGTSSRRGLGASVRRGGCGRLRGYGRSRPRPRGWRACPCRPALTGDCEGGLGGFLGEVEVAEEADEGGEDAAPLVAEDALDQRSTTGRTSIAPPSRAAGTGRRARARRRGRRPRAGSSRRGPPWSSRRARRWSRPAVLDPDRGRGLGRL